MRATAPIATERPLVPAAQIPHARGVTLLEALDRVIDKGVVVKGEVFLQVADIQLVDLGLQLVLASSERMRSHRPSRLRGEALERQRAELRALERDLRRVQHLVPTVVHADTPKRA